MIEQIQQIAIQRKKMETDRYFDEMPEDRRLKALVVHKLVLELFPQSRVSLKYKMPTYESASGWFSIGNQKNYWSIYTCSTDKIADYLANHPEIKHGKGCLNFRKKDEIDIESLKQVIQNALRVNHRLFCLRGIGDQNRDYSVCAPPRGP
mgnify:CR=1 FL=1